MSHLNLVYELCKLELIMKILNLWKASQIFERVNIPITYLQIGIP